MCALVLAMLFHNIHRAYIVPSTIDVYRVIRNRTIDAWNIFTTSKAFVTILPRPFYLILLSLLPPFNLLPKKVFTVLNISTISMAFTLFSEIGVYR